MDKRKSLFVILTFLTLFVACESNPLDVSVPRSTHEFGFTNADEALMQASRNEINSTIAQLETELGDLLIYELSQNIRQNLVDSIAYVVYDFYQSDYIQAIEAEKSELATNLDQHEESINHAFDYLAHYFGDSILPKNIFYINKLFTPISCSDESISIGLESYISPESKIIQSIPSDQYYQWQRNRMDPQYLERDVLLNWIQVHLFKELDGTLAEQMIQTGKILYILNACFPKATEAYILRYSEEQYAWARDNELPIWNYLIEQQMLFKNDETIITNFLNEGPTTVGLADGAPDRFGHYLGYKIVKGYMLKNKALSLQELIHVKYNNILQSYEIK